VTAIITPSRGHGEEIAKCSKIWKDAKLYGTSREDSHGQPQLQWNWIFQTLLPPFGSELQVIPIKGHYFQEIALYHPETKSLLGLTDLFVSVDFVGSNFTGKLYCLCLGLFRGNQSKPFSPQSYHYFFTNRQKEVKESIEEIYKLDVHNVVLGHGGICQGPNALEQLENPFDWCLNPKKQWTRWESFYYPCAYVWKSGLLRLMLTTKGKKQQKTTT